MKTIVIESTLVEMPPFARYRQGYIDGYTSSEDPRMPHDGDYMTGFQEGRTDDSMGIRNKYEEGGRNDQED